MSKQDAETWHDLRMIDRTGVFHVHHHGTKASARERIRRMAQQHYPKDEGYTYTGLGKESDCVTVKRKGKWHADCAAEPLESPESDET